ncbi:hypothetical protein BV22DRAFT_1127546 [Leucogyrophana mollusca]|uniref:Uncharacterized protein n=1 Tax=Leucogyrophana mollusca TaxID=85980 RepID=A0ACB8BRS4_9AGAM|nr:hypothetical protein BV22DRAFT_1127546 [Leucogyrophana mollusca]
MEAEIVEIVNDLKALQVIAFIRVATLVITLYDHVQNFAEEVELIWRGPVSGITVLYILNRYTSNALLIVGATVIPFDVLLFGLAARISAKDAVEVIRSGGVGRANSLMKVLARDSLIYFLINLILMIVTIVGWVSLPATYNEAIALPLIDSVLVIANSRLVLGLRARRARAGVQIGDHIPVGISGGIRVMDEGIPMHVLNIRRCDP